MEITRADMIESFSTQLRTLRTDAKLTNHELARRAGVPASLISGLQNNNRRVGEHQALKIGKALGLTHEALDEFVYRGIDTCTEKVLNAAKPYPSQLLNLLAVQLKQAGIDPGKIQQCTLSGDKHQQNVTLTLVGGGTTTLKTQLVSP
jgi:transcriptional regulator with XRE-family HTH domain